MSTSSGQLVDSIKEEQSTTMRSATMEQTQTVVAALSSSRDSSSASSTASSQSAHDVDNQNLSIGGESLNESHDKQHISQQGATTGSALIAENSSLEVNDYVDEENNHEVGDDDHDDYDDKLIHSKLAAHSNKLLQAHDRVDILKKLEAIKELKNKTMSLQQVKSKLLEEVDAAETENKCLQNFQTELDLLVQEKLAHLEELRQIQNDIMTMEETIKQSQEEKKRALESVRRLHGEYKPLKEEINHLREVIGLNRVDETDDNQTIDSFLSKMQIIGDVHLMSGSKNKPASGMDTKTAIKLCGKKESNEGSSNSNKYVAPSREETPVSAFMTPNVMGAHSSQHGFMEQFAKSTPSFMQHHHNQPPNATTAAAAAAAAAAAFQAHLKQQDLSAQLATMASLMAHSFRSQSPIAPQPASSGNNNLNFQANQFTQFLLNQSGGSGHNKADSPHHHHHHSPAVSQAPSATQPTQTSSTSSSSSSSQISSLQSTVRQQPPPMKSCLSCNQQIHRNAPICPLCKAKSRSRNPKKPKKKGLSGSPNSP